MACTHGGFRGCIVNHDLDMFAMSQGTECFFKANNTANISRKLMCSLVSLAAHSSPVEESLVAAPQPCFEASELIVISTSPPLIGSDADWIESIHHLSFSLAWLDRHSLASKFHFSVLRAAVLSLSKMAVVEGSVGNPREICHHKLLDLGYFSNSSVFAVKQVRSCLF